MLGRRIPVFLWIVLVFIKKHVLGIKKGPKFEVFEMCWDDGFHFFLWILFVFIKKPVLEPLGTPREP